MSDTIDWREYALCLEDELRDMREEVRDLEHARDAFRDTVDVSHTAMLELYATIAAAKRVIHGEFCTPDSCWCDELIRRELEGEGEE